VAEIQVGHRSFVNFSPFFLLSILTYIYLEEKSFPGAEKPLFKLQSLAAIDTEDIFLKILKEDEGFSFLTD
jgi:hypothetical protein